MAKSRRGVQFQHRNGSHQNGRRPSISESDNASEPGSPASATRAAMNGKLETSKEEVRIPAYGRQGSKWKSVDPG